MQRAYGGAAALALSHQLGAPMELATPIAGIGAAAAPQLIKGIMGTQAWQSATAATRKAALNVLFSKGPQVAMRILAGDVAGAGSGDNQGLQPWKSH